ncbi:GHMP kinase [Sulfolobus acidocaldarius DSM 639]|uniref:phosphomevalonate kinase n=1 Tax=Sulfolobus acidocaldarius (strain ATCC 33909 / DSM 639 / JCM 8929 / NBRC 15157 / NCIMB 11770) TaxID=330779 RepID=Q4J9E0_SULAC|nr:GHMP kinase [Sulfolobus acidocaldarius DSM 639]
MKKIKKVVASAPGKVLWIGSYSVVFGGISHSIAINKRVRAECEYSPSDDSLFETSYGVFKGKGNSLIESVISQFPNLPKVHVKLINDKDFLLEGRKTGLGSSSASTVALTACLYALVNENVDLNEIHKISQVANYQRQRGIGSGFDIATAVYGSIVYKRFTDIQNLDTYIEPLRLGDKYQMALAFIGESYDTVNSVAKFVEKRDLEQFKQMMKYIDAENSFAIKLLKDNKLEQAVEHLKLSRLMLEQLAENVVGVKIENEKTIELRRIAEKYDALIAMSPGAGGESVFAIGYDLSRVIEEWKKIKGIYVINLKEDEGLKVET